MINRIANSYEMKKNPRKKTKILIIEDHPIVRYGLVQLIQLQNDFEVIGEAEDVQSGWDLANSQKPDLVLLDISLKGTSGIDFIKKAAGHERDFPIIVLSIHSEQIYAERILRLGARGYIMKQEATTSLVTAIRCVLGGEIYLSPVMKSDLLDRYVGTDSHARNNNSPVKGLTNRELDVFRLIGNGMSTSTIARELKLNIKTIESHRQNIRKKLYLKDSVELLHYALQWAENDDF